MHSCSFSSGERFYFYKSMEVRKIFSTFEMDELTKEN